jgi:hypothetical protein
MNSITGIDSKFEQGQKVVNSDVRICVACGNIGVKIDSHGIYCKNCDTKFQREEVCVC